MVSYGLWHFLPTYHEGGGEGTARSGWQGGRGGGRSTAHTFTTLHDPHLRPSSGAGSAKGLMDAATALLTNEHITRIASVEEFEQFALSRPGVAKVWSSWVWGGQGVG